MIDKRAEIHSTAKIAPNVEIGPWTLIGADVEIQEGTKIASHVVISGPCVIGKKNRIYQFSSLGEDPQDKKYQGEKTELLIGDGNLIREFCTINRGTIQDKGITKIGHHNWIMAYVHIAHDCVIGNHCVFSNNATLAGHVTIGDYVTLGGLSAVHQFCTIGDHTFLGNAALVSKDVPPYLMVAGETASVHGLNTEGLKRRSFSEASISALKKAYKIIYRENLTLEKALPLLEELGEEFPEVLSLVTFLKSASRGIIR